MGFRNGWPAFVTFCFLVVLSLSACQTSKAPAGTNEAETARDKRLSPVRVDVRGSIIRSQYNQGQVMLEVEGVPSQYTRYNRAYVLVLPVTQIIGTDGKPAGLTELRQGQNVAVLLRSGGQGNQQGMGIARKIWLEELY